MSLPDMCEDELAAEQFEATVGAHQHVWPTFPLLADEVSSCRVCGKTWAQVKEELTKEMIYAELSHDARRR